MKHVYLTLTLVFVLAILSSCTNASLSADNSAANKEKVLIPDESWSCYMPDGIPSPEKGTLVFEIQMNIDKIYNVGKTQFGMRKAYVIKDGKVTGDKFQADVMQLGLDYDLTLSNGVVEIEQINVLRTNDNGYIYVRCPGTGINENDVRVVMDFEAPNNSSAAWLNTGKFVARRIVDEEAKTITMKVYDVNEVAIDAADTINISKPEGIPYQSWDFRKASQGEQAGEQIITELVTLGGSCRVGASKRGNRNIILITGGTLEGMIKGIVIPGGADYQNLAQNTIDARYMWETEKGEIIIVRNAGAFSGLVPTFETNVEGEFAWLNSGLYLSSGPGIGAGGVTLTMYKSKTQ
ncbi:MAG: DUF3237 family protein [Sedimentisphaerales bacterium]|nr:DUF3237 family protein [Sedimentisphaerales bacterium]